MEKIKIKIYYGIWMKNNESYSKIGKENKLKHLTQKH